jgi:hypothetical protein
MKTKILITVTIFLLITFLKQEPLSNVVDIKLPNQIEKVERSKLKLENSKFKYSKISEKLDHIYKINNIILSFWDLPISPTNVRTLEQMKVEGSGLLTAKETLIETNIIKINTIRFLITKYHNAVEYYYRFYSEFKNYKNISGIVQFKKIDIKEADLLFDNLIKSMKFKS